MPIVRNEEELTDENLRRILSYSLAIDYDIEIDGEFIKDEADKKIKTEPLFFEDRVCSNNYTFVLNIADGNVILTASVNTPDFIRGAEGGEDARKRATQLLKRALTAKGVKIIENHNDSVIYFSREQLKKNAFLKTTTMGEVDMFLDKIKTDPEAREKLAKDILAIANNLDFHIDQSKDIERIRAHRKKQFEEGDGTEGYEKSVYTYPKREGEEEGYPEGLIKRKRVKISDSPFWVSIYVVNGEFVIATQEDHIYLGSTSQQMVDLKEALEKNIDFKKVFDAAKKKGSDMVYVGNRMYFTQNAFNELKKNKEAAIKKVDEPLINAAKFQSIKKEVLSANNLRTICESPKITQDTLDKAIKTLGFNFERSKEIISNAASDISLSLQQEDFDSHDNDIVQSIRQAIESKLPTISQKYSKGIEVEARESITNQEETKSNKLIVDRFSVYKTKAELKAASRVLGKIPHTIITAEDLQFLPCEDSEKYKMTARNVDDIGDWKANTLPSSPKETYVKLGGNFAEQLQPQTKNPSKAFQPYGARFEWMHFQETGDGQKIFGTAYLLNAKFNNCVFDGVDFSKIPEEALKTISFNDCVFTNNCKPEGIEKRNKDMKAEVEDVKKIVNAITGDTWDKARNNWKAVIEARKKEDPKPKVSLAKYESVGAGLTNLVAKLNEIRSTHKTR